MVAGGAEVGAQVGEAAVEAVGGKVGSVEVQVQVQVGGAGENFGVGLGKLLVVGQLVGGVLVVGIGIWVGEISHFHLLCHIPQTSQFITLNL